MITIVTGVPGSGKSYFAVDKISKLKDQKKILHNVDGLKVGTSMDEYCSANDLAAITLFTNGYHKENEEFRGWIFIIDECQTLFPKSLRNEDVQRFFQLHRHYGIDIVLLSQDYKLISPSISVLAEFQFRAVSDTANPVPFHFMYKQMVGYEEIGRKLLRKRKAVFKLYKTADFDQDKVRKKARPMLIIGVVCLVLGVLAVVRVVSYKNKVKDGTKPNEQRMSLKERKQIEQRRTQGYGSGTGYSEKEKYPDSYLEKLGDNTLIRLDLVTDSEGNHIYFMGVLWPVEDFPYKKIKTRLGEYAMVPLDLKEYIEKQKEERKEKAYRNPNDLLAGSRTGKEEKY